MERLNETGRIAFRRPSDAVSCRIGIGLEKLDRALYDPGKAYDSLEAIGVHWVRLQSGWMRTETEKGRYDFGWLDEIVDQLRCRGMQPWICLCYGNPLYSERAAESFGGVGCPPIAGEANEAWLRYVDATVRHFEGRVDTFEIWNEADHKYSWRHEGYTKETDPGPSAQELGVFTRDTARAIHAANADAKAVGFAAGRPNAPGFYEEVFTVEGLASELDCVSFHAYKSDDTARAEHYARFKQICREANPKIRIIQGEGGTQSRSDGAGALNRMAWTPEKQTKYLLRGMLRDLHDPDIFFTSYFSTMDMVEALNGTNGDVASYLDYGYFGVLGADFDEAGHSVGKYTPKPSYYALGHLISVFSEGYTPVTNAEAGITRLVLPSRRVNGYDCDDRTLTGLSFRKPDGTVGYVYWNAVNLLTSTYEGTVSLRLPRGDRTKFRLYDLNSGKIFTLPEQMVDTVSDRYSVRLVNLPLTDSPLMLTVGR